MSIDYDLLSRQIGAVGEAMDQLRSKITVTSDNNALIESLEGVESMLSYIHLEGEASNLCAIDFTNNRECADVINDPSKGRVVDEKGIIAEMVEVLSEMDGDDLANAHNEVCANRAEYIEDSQWKITPVL